MGMLSHHRKRWWYGTTFKKDIILVFINFYDGTVKKLPLKYNFCTVQIYLFLFKKCGNR